MSELETVVGVAVDGMVAVLSVDNPPVNALSAVVRAGLLSGLRDALADPTVAAIVLRCAGRTFVAGADIREFGKPAIPPPLAEVLAAVETATKPVVAAIHGTALGGGLELALACHARVALASARVGLPEIRLGVIPGGGGTQRLPRLIGVDRALDMILSGDPIDATTAHAWGAVDRLVADGEDLLAAALAEARDRATADLPPPRARDREATPHRIDAVVACAARRAALLAADPDEVAGIAAIDAMAIGLTDGFEAGLAAERAAFLVLHDSRRAAEKREAFFAARRKPAS